MEIKFVKNNNPKTMPPEDTLGFGKYFTDHMLMMDYTPDKGWHDLRIVPFENLSIHPACTALHYGSEIFEGLKAYRRADGEVQLFRPIENIRRMNNSAERLCLPEIPEDLAMFALTDLAAPSNCPRDFPSGSSCHGHALAQNTPAARSRIRA